MFIFFWAAHAQLLANIGMDDTSENIGKQLQRGSTVWLEMGIWKHWIGQQSVYQLSSPHAVHWVIEQAAHLRRQCYTDITSRSFALSLTMEKHGLAFFLPAGICSALIESNVFFVRAVFAFCGRRITRSAIRVC